MDSGYNVGLYNAPLIVEAIMTATLAVSDWLEYIDTIAHPLDGIALPSTARISSSLNICSNLCQIYIFGINLNSRYMGTFPIKWNIFAKNLIFVQIVMI